jgi:catechol 2,3-dioxygenase
MMNTQTQSVIEPEPSISLATALGHIHLTVANLERQVAFYQNVLGFKVHWRDGTQAGLGAGGHDLLRLTEFPGARRVQGTTGMYHFAILYPSRRELARAIARLFALRYPNAPTDHVVSKTTYLDDPEGNTIELYVRTLEAGTMEMIDGNLIVRHADGRPSDGREPLDVEALFRELTPADRLDLPLPEGTKLGHVHLYAASLAASMHFYHEVLGFQQGLAITRFRMGDVGLSEDQPHVIAFNTWKGEGAPPSPPDTLGMRYFSVVLPDSTELERVLARVRQAGLATEPTEPGILVRDPSQISISLTASFRS